MNTIIPASRSAAVLASILALGPFASAQVAGRIPPAAAMARSTVVGAAAAAHVNVAAQTVSANVAHAATQASVQAQAGVAHAAMAASRVNHAATAVAAHPAGQVDTGVASRGATETVHADFAAEAHRTGATEVEGRDATSLEARIAKVDADDHGADAPEAASDDRGLGSTMSASGRLDTAGTSTQILDAAFTTRLAVAADVNKQIAASHHAIAMARSRIGQLSAEARASLEAAIKQARMQETELRASLHDLRVATADTFADARTKLASDFAAYASAVAQVQTGGTVATGGP